MKKILAVLLACLMLFSLVACGDKKDDGTTPPSTSGNGEEPVGSYTIPEMAPLPELTGDYDEDSMTLYNYVLKEYYDAYQKALKAGSDSEIWAMMALAEAKLMESAVMLPTTTEGGRYAISRVAPYTVTPTLWGNDQNRYQMVLVATEFIKAEDRAEMKEHYNEVKGDGTYMEWAKQYLTDKGYTLQDTYNMGYTSDPQTWDYFNTSRAADSEAIENSLEMLYEYDFDGNQQPALALSHTVSDDGLVYTFTLREGAVWVDSQGREIEPVTADSFVAGFQHMLDAQGGLEYLVDGIVAGAHEYITGETSDMADVGVKALDDYTLEYTLEAPCRYFISMLGYNPFAPMSRAYFTRLGGKFGADFDPTAANYTYGTSAETIAYCGPYLVSNHTDKNTIVFQANPTYWNADGINIKTLTWLFNDGTDVTKAYEDAKAGTLAGCSLTTNTIELAKKDGLFDEYVYISGTTATSFSSFWNINRAAYANVADETVAVSEQTEEQKALTTNALKNQAFRLAVSMAWDRAAYNAQGVGEDVRLYSLRNTYTPGNFVQLTEAVTVEINGQAVSFPEGTYYGEIMQAQITADNYPIKVWDPTMEDGAGSSDGFEGWYNVENAKYYLNAAIEQLAAQGIEITKETPVVIDLPYNDSSEVYTNRANAVKQSIETALDGYVVINLVATGDVYGWYYAGYFTDFGFEANYDTYDLSGWGPDYGDPATYLDTFLPEYAGYMVKCIGIF